MKKLINKSSLVILVALLVVSSCKKEEDSSSSNNNGESSSKTSILTSKEWRLTSQVFIENNESEEELICDLEECVKDNLLIFNSSLEFSVVEGALKCLVDDPDTISVGDWYFADNETKLVIDGFSNDLISLTSSKLKYRRTINNGDEVYTSTYVPVSLYDADSDETCEDIGGNSDSDNDGIQNSEDNCPSNYNPDQSDDDSDGIGNLCDEDFVNTDVDDDGVVNTSDNCPNTYNPDQADDDLDGIGDLCDDDFIVNDIDSDGVEDDDDNCPDVYNPNQIDFDLDGIGDVCDDEVIYLSQDFSNDEISPWTSVQVIGSIEWETGSAGNPDNAPYARISNYDGTGNVNSESWLVSPSTDLSNSISPKLSFISATAYSGDDIELYVSLNYTGGSINMSDWTLLNATFANNFDFFTWFESGDVDLSPYISSNVSIAFRYVGSNSDGATWEIDDILISE